jgi:hypothetical protein
MILHPKTLGKCYDLVKVGFPLTMPYMTFEQADGAHSRDHAGIGLGCQTSALGGGLNGSTQHFILNGEMEC